MEWWQVLLMFVAALAVGVLIGVLIHYLPKLRAKGRGMASMFKKQEADESVIEPVIKYPVMEEPVVEQPVMEEPVIKEPVIEKPVIEEPVMEEPVVEQPVIEKPVVEQPVIEKPVVEQPVIEEPVIEEPVIEEPVIEKPVIEEPVIEEPVIEKPVIEEPVIEEPATKKRVKVALPELLEEIVNNRRIATTPWEGKLLPFQTNTWETLQDNVNKVPANIHDDLAQIYIDIRLANSIVRLATDFNRRSGSLDESYKKLCTGIAKKLNRIKPQIE
jgi:hypothetical protein